MAISCCSLWYEGVCNWKFVANKFPDTQRFYILKAEPARQKYAFNSGRNFIAYPISLLIRNTAVGERRLLY
jgi:hypothetical protein